MARPYIWSTGRDKNSTNRWDGHSPAPLILRADFFGTGPWNLKPTLCLTQQLQPHKSSLSALTKSREYSRRFYSVVMHRVKSKEVCLCSGCITSDDHGLVVVGTTSKCIAKRSRSSSRRRRREKLGSQCLPLTASRCSGWFPRPKHNRGWEGVRSYIGALQECVFTFLKPTHPYGYMSHFSGVFSVHLLKAGSQKGSIFNQLLQAAKWENLNVTSMPSNWRSPSTKKWPLLFIIFSSFPSRHQSYKYYILQSVRRRNEQSLIHMGASFSPTSSECEAMIF